MCRIAILKDTSPYRKENLLNKLNKVSEKKKSLSIQSLLTENLELNKIQGDLCVHAESIQKPLSNEGVFYIQKVQGCSEHLLR